MASVVLTIGDVSAYYFTGPVHLARTSREPKTYDIETLSIQDIHTLIRGIRTKVVICLSGEQELHDKAIELEMLRVKKRLGTDLIVPVVAPAVEEIPEVIVVEEIPEEVLDESTDEKTSEIASEETSEETEVLEVKPKIVRKTKAK